MEKKTDRRLAKKHGQGLVEYVALTALVAIVCISTVKIFGAKVSKHLNEVSNRFDHTIHTGLHSKAAERGEDGDEGDEDNGGSRGSTAGRIGEIIGIGAGIFGHH